MGEAHKNKVRQRHIFKFEFLCYAKLVNFAKHTNKQCAAQQNMPRVQTYICFFRRPTLPKICW